MKTGLPAELEAYLDSIDGDFPNAEPSKTSIHNAIIDVSKSLERDDACWQCAKDYYENIYSKNEEYIWRSINTHAKAFHEPMKRGWARLLSPDQILCWDDDKSAFITKPRSSFPSDSITEHGDDWIWSPDVFDFHYLNQECPHIDRYYYGLTCNLNVVIFSDRVRADDWKLKFIKFENNFNFVISVILGSALTIADLRMYLDEVREDIDQREPEPSIEGRVDEPEESDTAASDARRTTEEGPQGLQRLPIKADEFADFCATHGKSLGDAKSVRIKIGATTDKAYLKVTFISEDKQSDVSMSIDIDHTPVFKGKPQPGKKKTYLRLCKEDRSVSAQYRLLNDLVSSKQVGVPIGPNSMKKSRLHRYLQCLFDNDKLEFIARKGNRYIPLFEVLD